MNIHLFFDILAFTIAPLLSFLLFKTNKPMQSLTYGYYVAVMFGALIGGFGLGTVNLIITFQTLMIGKSILGALCGGIIAAEIYKYQNKIHSSTGAYFVPTLVSGIAIGRLGCFFSGLEDQTCGTPTTLLIGCDFGDGIARHPVQLYESIAMLIFFIGSYWLYKFKIEFFQTKIFYYFILYYGVQRFIWEFFKPYTALIMHLNLFHFCSLFLIIYGMIYLFLKKSLT